jgi:hypothetical protein
LMISGLVSWSYSRPDGSRTRPPPQVLSPILTCTLIFSSNLSLNRFRFLRQPQCPETSHVIADSNRALSDFLESFRTILGGKALPFQSRNLLRRRDFIHTNYIGICRKIASPAGKRPRGGGNGAANLLGGCSPGLLVGGIPGAESRSRVRRFVPHQKSQKGNHRSANAATRDYVLE